MGGGGDVLDFGGGVEVRSKPEEEHAETVEDDLLHLPQVPAQVTGGMGDRETVII